MKYPVKSGVIEPLGRLHHHEQLASFMAKMAFEQAPNLHAGPCQGRAEPKVAQELVVSQPPQRLWITAKLTQKKW
jgi:hypothetical protein